MKIFVLLLLLSSCLAPAENQSPSPSPEVIKEDYNSQITPGRWFDLHRTYSLKKNSDCVIRWDIHRTLEKTQRNILLRNRTDSPQCKLSFEELKADHIKVLVELLKDFKVETIQSLGTPSLKSIQHNGSWGNAIANAAAHSSLWQDYRKNYPNHKSKLSPNAIFIGLLNELQPHEPFRQMLKEVGIVAEIKDVEKVFTRIDLETKKSVIYDAGSLSWEIIPSEK